jgi:hypothetical protein
LVASVCWALVRWRGLRSLSILLDDDITEPLDKFILFLLLTRSEEDDEEVMWELVRWMIVLFLLGILPLDGIELVVWCTSKTSSTRLTSLTNENDFKEGAFCLEVVDRIDLDAVVVLPD